MNSSILDFDAWVQDNETDLNDGWEEDFNRKKFKDIGEYLHYYHEAYVKAETHKRRAA